MIQSQEYTDQLLFKFPDYVNLAREYFIGGTIPWKHFYRYCYEKLDGKDIDATFHSVLVSELKLHNATLHRRANHRVYVLFESGKDVSWFNLKWSQ